MQGRRVLDDGFVRLVDVMGDDQAILQAARVSTGASSKGSDRDRGLIRYLYRNQHMTPFEMAELKFHVRAPIFVARQWFRHRTGSFNEASARYKEMPTEFFYPDEWRAQGTKNHQGSGDALFEEEQREATMLTKMLHGVAGETYDALLKEGVAREQSRIVLPVSLYTEWYWKVDFRNLLHFLDLRLDSHAQKEIREYADAVLSLVVNTERFPYTLEIFNQVREVQALVREAMSLDRDFEDLPDLLRTYVDTRTAEEAEKKEYEKMVDTSRE